VIGYHSLATVLSTSQAVCFVLNKSSHWMDVPAKPFWRHCSHFIVGSAWSPGPVHTAGWRWNWTWSPGSIPLLILVKCARNMTFWVQ
jgi:hypothetical protein